MLRVQRTGRDFAATVKKVRNEAREVTEDDLRAFATAAHDYLMENTPVWTGRAIANYRWSEGTEDTTSVDPIESGDPGEGRRSVNAAISTATLERLNYTPGQRIYVTNNASYPSGLSFEDLEYGRMPAAGRSRVPAGGLLRMAVQVGRQAMYNNRRRRARGRRAG